MVVWTLENTRPELYLCAHRDPLVTKLDFDKEPTPGPKHYPAPEDSREPPAQHKLPDKEEVQVRSSRNGHVS